MSSTLSLREFLLARVGEEELLARAFDDAAAAALCADKRRIVAGGDGGPGWCLLGLLYVDHPDYRYSWMNCPAP